MSRAISITPETEDAASKMDSIYRYQRYVYDLTRKYYLLGRDKLIRSLNVPRGGSVLEVGCGTGRNLVATALLYPEARVYGFDISNAMFDTSVRAIKRKGLTERVIIAKADATNFQSSQLFGVDGFDRVYISYTLSMIPVWHEVLPCAADALKPGGELHVVDFGMQERLPGWFKRGLFAWLERFSVRPSGDVRFALEYIARQRGYELRFQRLYRDYAYHVVLRRPA